ncbi:alpha-amylase family glycosyl hydrolase [Paenibacillus sp. R14(2021)]|uniref:alpha-amylase family glycosyl hydrolase n=1 Tax=Paenibacillus sp. R14(2021) TaxID=2859228 RepID=UPI001C615B82|nr:alpha-amylase family glycosyl hydrolase [Paenibacillus sp. R14(2021)]
MLHQATRNTHRTSVQDKLQFLYGDRSAEIMSGIEKIAAKYEPLKTAAKPWVSENDVMLITYGDSVQSSSQRPLETLHRFLNDHLKETLSAVHILPFYPFTSDDGFSVTDYRAIDPALGNWADIQAIAADYDMMYDAVINHISKSSEWFQGYLNGDPQYADYFIEADPSLDYSAVTRPRALPLLTPFETSRGEKHIWTTFSEDQIDLNFQNPDVLLDILDILVMYAIKGARFIRLDAIGFAWKKHGTTCMHLEETHALIKVMRDILDELVPGTIMITETNVPHDFNISYFGNGYDEAQMVYQFPLPPLTMFSFLTGSAGKLLQWADSLEPTTEGTTFFNFLASHDGVGVRPTEGILTEAERQLMVDRTLQHGGRVSFKNNPDGSTSPYELNITYVDALTHPDEPDEVRINRFLAAQTILLSVAGVPGIYIHSLLGSQNHYEGVEQSGINRRINREKLDIAALEAELASSPVRKGIFERYSALIKRRRAQSAFHPQAKQEVLFLDDRVFAVARTNASTGEQVIVLVNVSADEVPLALEAQGTDLISGRAVNGGMTLMPYEAMWVKTNR